jgi:uncharacterized protein (TIGR02099 family)
LDHLLRRHLRFWVRSFWGAVLFVIIALAVMVQLGRALFPVLNDYRGEMEQQLSAQLGVQVEVGNISAKWTGLRPRVTFTAVAVRNRNNEPVFQVERVSAEVSLLSTVRDWRLGFRKVTFTGLSGVLHQNERGHWWVQGLERITPPPPLVADQPRFRDPLDIFLFGRRVELMDTHLTLLFRSGLSTELAIPHIRLENDAQFHRLAASFGVDEEQQSLYLVVEGTGDPRDDAHFDARGYLHLQRFPSAKVLAALGIRDDLLSGKDSSTADSGWRDDGRVTLSLWFQGTSSRGVTWNGEVAVDGSPLRPPAHLQWPASLQSRLTGSWEPQRGWQMSAADMRLSWADFAAPPLDLTLRGSFGGETELALASLDLARWSEVAQRAGLVRGRAQEMMATLQPQGELRNVQLLRRPAEQGHFVLRGNIIDGQVAAWQGAPALTGVNGFVETSALGGEILLRSEQGFAMTFPLLYDHALSFLQAEGAMRWEIDKIARKVYLSSGLVKLVNDEVSARGHFNLHLPFDRGGEPEMTLVVGVRKGHTDLHRTLMPRTAPEPLLQWLDRAVVSGDVRDAGFIYHGSLRKDPTAMRVIQLRGHVDNAEIAFDPAWPPLRQGAGDLYLDDQALSITGLEGALEQVNVAGARVDLRQLAGGGRGVRIQASVAGESGEAKKLLAQTPLRGLGGKEVANWQWQGALAAEVDVLVPLDHQRSDAARQKIRLRIDDNRLHMPELNLTFDKVAGQLTYDSTTGLSSSGIDARLWGEPVHTTLRTEPAADGRTLVVDFRGKLDIADVQGWSRRPELSFASGSSPVSGELRVPMGGRSPLRLSFSSTLKGVTLAAPPPFRKDAGEIRSLRVLIENHPGDMPQSYYTFILEEVAELRWESRAGRMQAADLSLAKNTEPLQPGLFHIRGPIAQADALQWREILEQYITALKVNEASSAPQELDEVAAESLPIRVDLQIGVLHAGDLLLNDVRIRAAEDERVWRVQLEHETLAGRVIWSPGDAPLQVDLDRLYLPGEKEAPAADAQLAVGDGISVAGDPFTNPSNDFWRNLDLASVPAADIRIADLRNGTTALGRWAMKLRPIERGLLAYDLTADTVGLAIGGRGKPGAEVVWTRTPTGDSSYFSGVIRARDLADTFRQLKLEPALSSDSATLDVDLQWPGPPVEVDLLKLAGMVDLSVQRGVFSRGGSVGENPLLKLIGLLNFDTLARRLRLDFSDLGTAGLAYEEIDGALLFRNGTVHIRQPLQVDTPSSHLQLVGDLDMARETLDTQLVATLPLAGNLTVAAALTGGVPLAIGVYVVGKIFKDQVERVSSLRYSVTGSWNNPEAKLERIFENSVADPASQSDPPVPSIDSSTGDTLER